MGEFRDRASGTDIDSASVNANDVVDGMRAGLIVSTTGLTCERLTVDGVAVPRV